MWAKEYTIGVDINVNIEDKIISSYEALFKICLSKPNFASKKPNSPIWNNASAA